MASNNQVAEIEKKVKRIERDLASIRASLKRLQKKRTEHPTLADVQESISHHLVSDEDPAEVIQHMRHGQDKNITVQHR